MSFSHGGILDRISEEVNSDSILIGIDQYDTLCALGLDSLFANDPFSSAFNVAGECDIEHLAGKLKK
jgi:hypothetical protein